MAKFGLPFGMTFKKKNLKRQMVRFSPSGELRRDRSGTPVRWQIAPPPLEPPASSAPAVVVRRAVGLLTSRSSDAPQMLPSVLAMALCLAAAHDAHSPARGAHRLPQARGGTASGATASGAHRGRDQQREGEAAAGGRGQGRGGRRRRPR